MVIVIIVVVVIVVYFNFYQFHHLVFYLLEIELYGFSRLGISGLMTRIIDFKS